MTQIFVKVFKVILPLGFLPIGQDKVPNEVILEDEING